MVIDANVKFSDVFFVGRLRISRLVDSADHLVIVTSAMPPTPDTIAKK